MAEFICETPFTIKWLCAKIFNESGVSTKLLKWNCQPIGVGEGSLASIFKVEFQWSEDCNLPNSVVLKLPITNPDRNPFVNHDLTAIEALAGAVHQNEMKTYQLFGSFPDLPFPLLYYAQPCNQHQLGILVMEDMTIAGVKAHLTEEFCLEQLLSIADGLAKIHGECLINTSWIDQFIIEPVKEPWVKVLSRIPGDIENNLKPVRPEFYEKVLVPVLRDYNPETVYYWQFEAHKELDLPPVLAHGDMFSGNMFFKADNSNEILVFIDWQLAHPGSCLEDLVNILVCKLSGETRHKLTKEVIEYYYQRLSHYTNNTVPFTLDGMWKAYKSALRPAMMYMVIACSMITEMAGDDMSNVDRVLERTETIINDVKQ